MKLKRLMEKAEALFNADKEGRKERKKNIKKVLKKLSKYEKSLKQQIKEEDSLEQRSKLEKKLSLTHAHRIKGLSILKDMKAKKAKVSH